jgi:hypothetical protein
MSDSAVEQDRLTGLLDLLRARRPARKPLPPIALEEALVAQHLSEIESSRFAELAQLLRDNGDSPSPSPTAAEELALRLLLDDYAAALRRLRAVTDVTGQALSRVASTVKHGQRFIRKQARPDAVTPP